MCSSPTASLTGRAAPGGPAGPLAGPNHHSGVPDPARAPVVLQHAVPAQHDELQVEAEAALDERDDAVDAGTEGGAQRPKEARHLVVAPPMLNGAIGQRHAQLEVAVTVLVRHPVLTLDQDRRRRGGDSRAEGPADEPGHGAPVVAPPVLHPAILEHGHQLQVAPRALDEGSAHRRDGCAEVRALMSGEGGVPPPVLELGGAPARHDLEVTRTVATLDEADE